jgi:hypothetical protein
MTPGKSYNEKFDGALSPSAAAFGQDAVEKGTDADFDSHQGSNVDGIDLVGAGLYTEYGGTFNPSNSFFIEHTDQFAEISLH